MIIALSIICGTIITCMLIRYICIWNCQQTEYKIYKDLHKQEFVEQFVVRPYLYNGKNGSNSFWGYIVYDVINDCIYKGSDKTNENFIIYRKEESAEDFCKTVRKMHGN